LTRNPELMAMGLGELIGLPSGVLAGLRNTADREIRISRTG
jgi:hypothetical protein